MTTSVTGVSMILQWGGLTGVDPGTFQKWAKPGFLGRVGSQSKALVGGLRPAEAEAKCEISVRFLTFFCRAWAVFLYKHTI